MSFSSDVKEELSTRIDMARHCQIAEFAAIMGMSGRIRRASGKRMQIEMSTENEIARYKFIVLLEQIFDIDTGDIIYVSKSSRDTTIRIENQEYVAKILQTLKWADETFDNIDIEGNYAAIEPHTPCPVLYGIRGNTPSIVEEAHNIVKSYEQIEDYCIFRTNQHTDMHIQHGVKIKDMVNTGCYCFSCEVVEKPYDIEGGHVFFKVSDNTDIMECAAFEPTKSFRDIVRKLCVGDKLTIYGGLNDNHTFNIEKFKLNEIAPQYEYSNPICVCGKRMKSAGKDKGFKCPKCSRRLRNGKKIRKSIPRDLDIGFYEVPTEARRHLAKPIVRMKLDN